MAAGCHEFHRVGRLDEFRAGKGRAVQAGGVRVAIFRLDEGWFAIQDACPHMGASLADGSVRECRVTCFWHDWKFDLRTGQGDMRQWAVATVFPVEIRDGAVYVGIPEPSEPDEGETGGEDEEWIRWDDDKFFKNKPNRTD